MATVAPVFTNHALRIVSNGDADGDINNQHQFQHQDHVSASVNFQPASAHGEEAAGSPTVRVEESLRKDHEQIYAEDSYATETMANGQLEGAADTIADAESQYVSGKSEAEGSDSSSSNEEGTEVVGEWEAASAEEASLEHAIRNNCVYVMLSTLVWRSALTNIRFCKQDEEHDPSEDFEEYMACAVCGDNGMFC